MISTFLLQLGAGCLFGALPVPAAATGRAFNRFVAMLGAVALVLGLGAGLGSGLHALSRPLWLMALVCAVASSALSNAGRIPAGRFLLMAAAAWSGPALALDGWTLARAAGAGGAGTARYVLDALSASWVLGTVLVAMILGHYYLNIAGLAGRHLVRLCLLALAAVSIRTIAFGWGFASDGIALVGPVLAGDAVDILPFVVLLQRVLFGLAGGIALCVMAWRTARIDSMQSATGILYIGFIAVIVGELASRYLLFGTGHVL